jgi:protein-S-isoprenylcysteine O-methyltransferase Ste14
MFFLERKNQRTFGIFVSGLGRVMSPFGIYGLGWVTFGLAHSLLARERAKGWLKRRCGRAMRLVWNLIALVQFALLLWLGRAVIAPTAWVRPGWLVGAQIVAGLAGAVLMVVAARGYDMGRFAGISQLLAPDTEDDEPFVAVGAQRFVRHPLYSATILLLAAIVSDALGLATLLFATIYILIGLRFEEAALLRRLGPVYAEYRARVPALIPWRGRAWSGS